MRYRRFDTGSPLGLHPLEGGLDRHVAVNKGPLPTRSTVPASPRDGFNIPYGVSVSGLIYFHRNKPFPAPLGSNPNGEERKAPGGGEPAEDLCPVLMDRSRTRLGGGVLGHECE